jgi:hypothetical protein
MNEEEDDEESCRKEVGSLEKFIESSTVISVSSRAAMCQLRSW